MIFFRSSLDVDVPEVEHGWDESVDRGCDVLDAGKSQFADMTVKETFLFNVDDAFIGNDPDIEIVVNPDEKSEEPQEQKECVLNKVKKWYCSRIDHIGEQERKRWEATENKKRTQDDKDELNNDIKPVTMNNAEHLFVLVLSLEVMATQFERGEHREELEKSEWEKFLDWKGKKQNRVGEKKNGKNSNKKKSGEDSRFAIKRVAQKMEDNKQRCHDIAEKEDCIEKTKDKTHIFIFVASGIVSSECTVHNDF